MRTAAALLFTATLLLANGALVVRGGGSVRLTAHRVRASVRDRVAEVTVEQVSINVDIQSSAPLTSLESPSHRAQIVRDGARKARVSWSARRGAQQRDFLLRIRRPKDAKEDVASLRRFRAEKEVGSLLEDLHVFGESAELRAEIIKLGTKHSIVTPYTAALVVEEGTPITVPVANSVLSAGRRGRRFASAGGAGSAEESAVERGLEWLSEHQDRNGSWGDAEQTGLALLAFLGANYTDRGSERENRYATTVRRGLRYLMANPPDGDPRQQAVAALALCEAYWKTRNPRYRRPAQEALNALVRVPFTDPVLTAWCVLALKSGEYGGLALEVSAFARARAALRRPGTGKEAASAFVARILLGEDPRESDDLQTLASHCLATAHRFDGESLRLATLGSFRVGRRHWKEWNEKMKSIIVTSQQRDGSWKSITATAHRLACLEVYYSYDRVFSFGVR